MPLRLPGALLAPCCWPAARAPGRAPTSTPTRSTPSRRPSSAPAACSPPTDVAAAEQRHPHGRLRRAAHRPDLRRRASCPTSSTTPATTTRSSAASPTASAATSFEKFLGGRREPGDAHRRELGVVPARRRRPGTRAPAGTAATSSAAATRASRLRRPARRTPRGCSRAASTTTGWCAPTARPWPAAARVPCSEPHSWRAVTTIKLGEPEDDYPGDRLVEVRDPRLLRQVGRAPCSATPSTTTSPTPGSTRRSGRSATAARSAGRRPTDEHRPARPARRDRRHRGWRSWWAGAATTDEPGAEPGPAPTPSSSDRLGVAVRRAAPTPAACRPRRARARATGSRYDEAVAPTASLRDVPCDQRRTPSVTFHVGELDTRRRRPPASPSTPSGSSDQVATTCPRPASPSTSAAPRSSAG